MVAILIFVVLLFEFRSCTTTVRPIRVKMDNPVVNVGDTFTMVCNFGYPITRCYFEIGKDKIQYVLSPEQNDGVYRIQYHGEGLHRSECGIRILSVNETDHGNIRCIVPAENDVDRISQTKWLTVRRAPEEARLEPSALSYVEGEKLVETCVVPHRRPSANISWYLDKTLITSGLGPLMSEKEENSDLFTTTQNLTNELTGIDSGKTLTCQAHHDALKDPLTVSATLDVQFSPKNVMTFITEGSLLVVFKANPRPTVTWYINNDPLQEGQQSEDGNLMAEPLEPVLKSRYIATLVIRDVQHSDVRINYVLKITGSHGLVYYYTVASTKDGVTVLPRIQHISTDIVITTDVEWEDPSCSCNTAAVMGGFYVALVATVIILFWTNRKIFCIFASVYIRSFKTLLRSLSLRAPSPRSPTSRHVVIVSTCQL